MKNINEVRRAVVTLANRINRKAHDLSGAFIRAWNIVKGKLMLSKVAGVSFGNRPGALAKLARINPKDISVELIREQDNQYDDNAVGVHVAANGSRFYQLGYLPREVAELVSSIMDKGVKLAATFRAVTGGTADYINYGALVEIALN